MRTRLMRGKLLLLFMTLGILLAIPAIAFAQDLTGSTPPAPTIQSDKADYVPGELVTLTGSGWQAGESVNIVVNDDEGQSWNRNVNVTADPSGNISDSFNLPDWFVATYSVTATGASGTATTTFTDSISFTSSSTNDNGAGSTSLTISKPGTVAQNDVMLAQITYAGGSSVNISGGGIPSGWNLVGGSATNNGTNIGQRVYFKVAGASEPASYTWTLSNSRKATGGISVYRGVDTSNPINVNAGATGTSNTPSAPSVTTTARTTQVARLFGTLANTSLSTPTNASERYERANTNAALPAGPTVAGDDARQFDVGATGTATSSAGASAAWVAQTVTLNWTQTATSDNGNGGSTSLTLVKPDDATANDVMIAQVTFLGNASVNVTAPSGWNLISKRTNTSGPVTQAAYWKRAGTSEPSDYTWTFGSSQEAIGGMTAYDNIITTGNPVDASATNPNTDTNLAASTNLLAPPVTTTAANDVVIALFGISTSANNVHMAPGPNPGLVERYDDFRGGSGNTRGVSADDRQQANVGLTLPITATADNSGTSVAHTIALLSQPTDTTPPTVSSIGRANASPTNTTGNLSWTVTFSENVSGVNAGDFALVNSGLGGSPTISSVTQGANASVYTVTASSGTGSGTLGLNLNDDDSIADTAGNKLGGTGTGTAGGGGTSNGSFTGEVYTIDRAAPTVTATAVKGPDFTDPYTADTWTNKDVRVTFTCADTGGGNLTSASGDDVQTFTNETNGSTATYNGTCADNAGNTATGSSSFGPIKIDKTNPTFSCPADDGTWHGSNQTFNCTANDGGSGLNPTGDSSFSLSTNVAAGNETNNASTGTKNLTDGVGNSATAGPISGNKVDRKAPVLTNNGPTPTNPNGANNWYITAVTNKFTATDGGSGFGTNGDLTKSITNSSGTNEGNAVKIASGAVSDAVGNTAASIDSAAFQIDLSDPTNVTFQGGPAAGGSYDFGDTPPKPSCTANDAVSGFDTCEVTGYSTAVGPHTMTATAKDNAGRTATETRSYTVKPYNLTGFYQPIDMNNTVNTVKNGSIVPVKFELFKGTTELTSTSAVTSIKSNAIECSVLSGDPEYAIEAVATGGTSLRYDTTAGQFIYNWTTPKGTNQLGKCYSLTMTAADSSSITAYFKLK